MCTNAAKVEPSHGYSQQAQTLAEFGHVVSDITDRQADRQTDT